MDSTGERTGIWNGGKSGLLSLVNLMLTWRLPLFENTGREKWGRGKDEEEEEERW